MKIGRSVARYMTIAAVIAQAARCFSSVQAQSPSEVKAHGPRVYGLEVASHHTYAVALRQILAHNSSERLPDFGDEPITFLPGSDEKGYQGAQVARVGNLFNGSRKWGDGAQLVEMPIHLLRPVRNEVNTEVASSLSQRYLGKGVRKEDLVGVGPYREEQVVAVRVGDQYFLLMGTEHVQALLDQGENFAPVLLYHGMSNDLYELSCYEAVKLATLRFGQESGVLDGEFVKAHLGSPTDLPIRSADRLRPEVEAWYRRAQAEALSMQQERRYASLNLVLNDPKALEEAAKQGTRWRTRDGTDVSVTLLNAGDVSKSKDANSRNEPKEQDGLSPKDVHNITELSRSTRSRGIWSARMPKRPSSPSARGEPEDMPHAFFGNMHSFDMGDDALRSELLRSMPRVPSESIEKVAEYWYFLRDIEPFALSAEADLDLPIERAESVVEEATGKVLPVHVYWVVPQDGKIYLVRAARKPLPSWP